MKSAHVRVSLFSLFCGKLKKCKWLLWSIRIQWCRNSFFVQKVHHLLSPFWHIWRFHSFISFHLVFDQYIFCFNPTDWAILPGFLGSGMSVSVYSESSESTFLTSCLWICLHLLLHPFYHHSTPPHPKTHTFRISVSRFILLPTRNKEGREWQKGCHLKPWQELQSFEQEVEDSMRGKSSSES